MANNALMLRASLAALAGIRANAASSKGHREPKPRPWNRRYPRWPPARQRVGWHHQQARCWKRQSGASWRRRKRQS
eukprot:5975372-Alexandrium_andersonii.AAC.1